MLYNPARHQPLRGMPWDPLMAETRLKSIINKTSQAYSLETLWSKAEDQELKGLPSTSIYLGAMGVLWGLENLKDYAHHQLPTSVESIADDIYQRYMQNEAIEFAEFGRDGMLPSYWLGETGILRALIELVPERHDSLQSRLLELIQNNINNPTLEPLWGGTGSIIAGLAQIETRPTASMLSAFEKHASYMRSMLQFDAAHKCGIWQQDLYGNMLHLLGAGHGFVGNLYPFVRGAKYLSPELAQWARSTAVETVIRSADIENDCANWAGNLGGVDRGRDPHLVQWCHGAPGVIISLNPIPIGYSSEFDDLLIKAGELIWQAGPLTKGIGLCHGTDGNGMALLKLYERTGDPLWLNRARSFAMHLIEESAADSALWVGDMGYAWFLRSCLKKDAHFPLLD